MMDPLETKLNFTTVEQDLNRRVTKTLERCTSCIYSLSNEPTLACFCIGEHLVKTATQLTEKRDEMRKLDRKLTGAIVDIEFSIDSIKMMKNSNQNFVTTQELIKNAIFCKQQIDYDTLCRKKFQQQMEKEFSIDDFRRFTNSANKETKRNAFQRFSTSFEASIEGLTSSASVDFKEFKEALNTLKNISQLATKPNSQQQQPNQVNVPSSLKESSQVDSDHSTSEKKISIQSDDDQPTSSEVLNIKKDKEPENVS